MTIVSNFTALLRGESWNGSLKNNQPAIVTYSFETAPQDYIDSDPELSVAYFGDMQEFLDSFQAFNSAQKILTQQALDRWSAVSGVNFVEVDPGEGEIRFAKYDLNIGQLFFDYEAFGFYPDREISGTVATEYDTGGDVFVNKTKPFTPFLITHEIGHALGLKHPFDTVPNVTLVSSLDDISNTILSYDGIQTGELGYLDIAAIRHVYGDGGASSQLLSWSWDDATDTIEQTWNNASHDVYGTGQKDIINGGGGHDRIAGMANDDVLDGGTGNDTLIGGIGNDMLDGGIGNDTLTGGIGNDVLLSGLGTDSFDGGLGTDTLDFRGDAALGATGGIRYSYSTVTDSFGNSETASGIEIIHGTDFSDTFNVDEFDTEVVYGWGGDDIFHFVFGGSSVTDGGDGNDTATFFEIYSTLNLQVGGLVNGRAVGTHGLIDIENIRASEIGDTLIGSSFDNVIDGFGGNDTIMGMAGNDTLIAGDFDFDPEFPASNLLYGGKGNDKIFGASGDDTLHGDENNDVLEGKAGSDIIDGGSGRDIASYASSTVSININLQLGTLSGGHAEGDTLIGIEGLAGGLVDDILTGSNGHNVLQGNGGDDLLNGLNGIDTASYADATGSVTVDLHTRRSFGADGNDTLVSIESAVGSAFGDTLRGSAFVGDTMEGGNGADTLIGRGGLDTMLGGEGDDRFFVQQRGDVVTELAGEGHDEVRVYFDNYVLPDNVEELRVTGSANRAFGNSMDNIIAGGAGGDELHGRGGNDLINGNGGGDILFGESGNDRLIGSSGSDMLYGGSFDDRLEGNGGIDLLDGGTGDDRLIGGGGRDFMTGGVGADRFIFDDLDYGGDTFSLADRILDFTQGENDQIDLRLTDANSSVGGDQAFVFIGTATFGENFAELRYLQSGNRTYVQGDTDGDGHSNFHIRLEGLYTLFEDDFML